MARNDFEQWERIRQTGRDAFIWKKGVVRFGLFMAALMTAVIPLLHLLFEDQPFDSGYLLRQFLINLVVFPLAGYLWGVWVWSQMEKNYQKEMRKGA